MKLTNFGLTPTFCSPFDPAVVDRMDAQGEECVARLLLEGTHRRALLLELCASRSPVILPTRCGGRLACGRCNKFITSTYGHIATHFCPPEWTPQQMQELGLLENGTCRACRKRVGGSNPHSCDGASVALVRYDMSALNEVFHDDSTSCEQLTRLRRLHGQTIVLMPRDNLLSCPEQAAARHSYQFFSAWVAPSCMAGAGLGVFCMHSLLEQPAAADQPQPSRKLVAPYTGLRVGSTNQQGDVGLSTLKIDGLIVNAAKTGGLAVLVNCKHGERANLQCTGYWHDRLCGHLGYLELCRELPAAGEELGYDYGGWCSTLEEYESEDKNPTCGCGCGGRLLPPAPHLVARVEAAARARQQAAEREQRAGQRAVREV